MTEIALMSACMSSQSQIFQTAVNCCALLAQAYRDPNAPLPPYLARNSHKSWRTFLDVIATAKPFPLLLGQAVAQKRVRDEITSNVVPCAVHLAGWRECYFRWSILSLLVHAPKGGVKPTPGIDIGPVTYKVCGRGLCKPLLMG